MAGAQCGGEQEEQSKKEVNAGDYSQAGMVRSRPRPRPAMESASASASARAERRAWFRLARLQGSAKKNKVHLVQVMSGMQWSDGATPRVELGGVDHARSRSPPVPSVAGPGVRSPGSSDGRDDSPCCPIRV